MIVLIALKTLVESNREKTEVAVKPKTLGANINHVARKPQMCKDN